jgi:hypothetical protein
MIATRRGPARATAPDLSCPPTTPECSTAAPASIAASASGSSIFHVSAFITHFDNVMPASPAEGHPDRLTRSLDVSLQLPQWAAVRQARADSSDGATGHRARR